MSEEKRLTVTEYLRMGVCKLLIDATQPGVDVPDNVRATDLQLNVSFKYAPPDLKVNTWGVTCTLSFSGQNCPVKVPWEAIYATRSAQGNIAEWEAPAAAPVLTKRRGIMGLVVN